MPFTPPITAGAGPLRFGRVEVRPLERQLIVAGAPVALGSRAFDVLLALAARAGQLVTKNELLDLVWPDVVVEENNLQVQVSLLRKMLGPEVIATIPGRGYRFTARVQADGASGSPHSAPAVSAAPPAQASARDRLRTNLPQVLAPLIGREDDVAALRALIHQFRLTSIVAQAVSARHAWPRRCFPSSATPLSTVCASSSSLRPLTRF